MSNGWDVFEIRVGRDQPLEDKVITFSHELGHGLDFSHSPMNWDEKANRKSGYVCQRTVTREVAAWGYGRQMLIDMNCWRYVEKRFYDLKDASLGTYIEAAEIQKNA